MKRNQGSALLLAILMVMILGIGATAVWQFMHMTLRETTHDAWRVQAEYLADSGIAHALTMLEAERQVPETPILGSMGEGNYTVTLEALDPFGRVRIHSTGSLMAGEYLLARRSIEVEAFLQPSGAIILDWRLDGGAL